MCKIETRKKYMIIVPHQDDELNVAGPLIYDLRKEHQKVYVLYTTNGDFYFNGKIRMKEGINTLKYLGVPEENVIFLGYGDGWEKTNIYNCEGSEIVRSVRGFQQTYGLRNHPEYRYQKSKCHSDYTRDNFKVDMKDAILDILPDVFMVVDFDHNAEHRATSLMFEEVMGEILKEKYYYNPVVLKKFAYAGAWFGENDYYIIPKSITQPPKKDAVLDSNFELDNPYFSWDNRLQFSVSTEFKTPFLKDNMLFKAARRLTTQMAWHRIIRICNSDMVFWLRRTDSLTFHAKIEVTSGNADYLNDFKLFDCEDVMSTEKDAQIINTAIWIPEQDDIKKEINITFQNLISVSQLVLYEKFDLNSSIKSIQVVMDNGYTTKVKIGNDKENIINIVFPKQDDISKISISIIAYEGENPGFSEIEVFENISPDISFYPLKLYEAEKDSHNIKPPVYKIRAKFEEVYLDFTYGCCKIIFIVVTKLIKKLKL